MLAKRINELVSRGIDTSKLTTPTTFHQASAHGTLHGDARCVKLHGKQARPKEVQPLTAKRYCSCAEDALDTDTANLLLVADELLEAEAELKELEGDLAGLSGARNILRSISVVEHGLEELTEWNEAVRRAAEAKIRSARENIRDPLNLARITREAALEKLEDADTQILDDVDSDLVAGGDYYMARRLEEETRDAFVEATREGLEPEVRERLVAETLLGDEPAKLNDEMFPFEVEKGPEPGETVQKWLRRLWRDEIRRLAKSITYHWETELLDLSNPEENTLVLVRTGWRGDAYDDEIVAAYGIRNLGDGNLILKTPRAVAYTLEKSKSGAYTHKETVNLEGVTDAQIEIALGLYDPSTTLKTLTIALDAARAM